MDCLNCFINCSKQKLDPLSTWKIVYMVGKIKNATIITSELDDLTVLYYTLYSNETSYLPNKNK
jgi:hypothetical protein